MENVELKAGDVLLIVDVQQDFLPPKGALKVPGGDEIIPILNSWIGRFSKLGLPIVASRDWHPEDHCSFIENGGSWPRHCVQGSPGAEFPDDLQLPASTIIVSKGTTKEKDAYSAFEGTDLADRLRQLGTKRLFVGGVATDYCVKATVLDALSNGFDVVVIKDAIRGVDIAPDDSIAALNEMERQGAAIL